MKLSIKTPPPPQEDIEDVKSAIAESLAEPTPAPEFVAPVKTAKKNIHAVRVLKRARNYRFVYADLDGERIAVEVPRNSRKSLIGKTVNVARATNADGETTYTLIP